LHVVTQCAVVRCGTSVEGLPIDVQLVTAPWRDDLALALAGTLESALGGYRPPSM
jgi:amidase